MHPFRALGKNSELLVVSDEKDTATWQRRSLALLWAGGLNAPTETEANHTRYAGHRPPGSGTCARAAAPRALGASPGLRGRQEPGAT